MIEVGIDMSLSSPALYAWNSTGNTYHILCFQQRKTDLEINNELVGRSTFLTRTSYPLEEEHRWAKVVYIVGEIMKWLDIIRGNEPVRAFIENYAFGMGGGAFGQSSSVSKLCELGGCLRYELWKRKWEFTELAITSVKKRFAADGRAEKHEMCATFQALGFPDLSPILQCEYHQHPLEDVVDACAILTTGHFPSPMAMSVDSGRKTRLDKR